MKWHYWCPLCGRPARADWAKRSQVLRCAQCKRNRRPPSPAEQPKAYVDGPDWPPEMEAVVRVLKGDLCTVPGCSRPAATLVHRVPLATHGRTSVNNLVPICAEHEQAKGDQGYARFLRGLRERETGPGEGEAEDQLQAGRK